MKFFQNIGDILAQHWQDFLLGVAWTIVISLVSTLIGLLLGLIIGIVRTIPSSKHTPVRVTQKIINFILTAYIEVFI